MKNIRFLTLIAILIVASLTVVAGPKLVKVKLTGSISEDIQMTVGNSGRTEVISHLPYVFQIAKDDLPLTLKFTSNNYFYVAIDVPRKPVDDIGHVYLLKKKETDNTPQYVANQQETPRTPQNVVKGIDTSYGVNAAPFTGRKAEKTFAIIIANENYEMASHVDMASNDGLAMKEYCSKTFGLTDKQILYYPDATFGKMKKAVNEFKNIARSFNGDCNLIFYYAGHGIPDNATKEAYLMPIDADGSDVSVCYPLSKLYEEIGSLKINQAVVFLDACFSGTSRDGDMLISARGVAIKPKEAKPLDNGNTIIFSATSDEETAFPYKNEKHGMFTYYLLKYFQEEKGKVELGDLADYIKENVSKQSILVNGKKQTPTITTSQNMDWRNLRVTGNK